MVGAYPLDPPLAVDVGVGDDWLAAKIAERNRAVPPAPRAAGDRVARYNPQLESGVAPCAAAWKSEETPYRYAPNER